MMSPFYFGERDKPLYGVLHPVSGSVWRREAVVLCYPYGQEYERSHRAFNIIAGNLNDLGYEVLRFDYSGTGDSWGGAEDISLQQWKTDIRTAVDEVKDVSGVDRVSLVGLRIGATLALELASESSDVQQVVCWDPVVNVESVYDEMKSVFNAEEVARLLDADDHLPVFFMGYPYTRKLRNELAAVDFGNSHPGKADCCVITSDDSPLTAAAVKRIADHGGKIRHDLVRSHTDWATLNLDGGILIPQPVISYITELFRQESVCGK